MVNTQDINENIKGTIYLPNGYPPVRAYVHSSCLGVYGSTQQRAVSGARDHLIDVLGNSPHVRSMNPVLIIAMLRANASGSRIIDLFSYSEVPVWPGDPKPDFVTIEDSDDSAVFQSLRGCEDSGVILAREAQLRGRTSSLEEYLRLFPPSKLLGLEERFSRTHLVVQN